MNWIYTLGLFLLPFDNLFFAPSRGWAAVSPIFFFLYIITCFRHIPAAYESDRKTFFFFWMALAYSGLLFLHYGFELSNLVDTLATIVLGLCFYYAILIRYVIQKKDLDSDIKIMFYGYSLAFLYGIIKYLSVKTGAGIGFFEFFEKRFQERASFSFTEASFISMHVYGILFILYQFVTNARLKKKLLILICLFIALSILFRSSARFLIDTSYILVIIASYLLLFKQIKKSQIYFKVFLAIFIIISGLLFFNLTSQHSRIKNIMERGVYGDTSLSFRYFRVNASLEGYRQNMLSALFGTGFGNAFIYFFDGYDRAFAEYGNPLKYEIIKLRFEKPHQLFSMPIRLVSELGFISTVFIFLYLFRLSQGNLKIFFTFLIVIWLYIQFDSYCFYTLWLFLFFAKFHDKKPISNEVPVAAS